MRSFTSRFRGLSLFFLVFSFTLATHGTFASNAGEAFPSEVLPEFAPGQLVPVAKNVLERPKEKSLMLLEFFTSTCGYCTQNIAKLKVLEQELSAKLDFKLVNVDARMDILTRYLDSHGRDINLPVSFDEHHELRRQLAIRGVPTNFIVDESNNIIYKKVGLLSDSDLQAIRDLIASH